MQPALRFYREARFVEYFWKIVDKDLTAERSNPLDLLLACLFEIDVVLGQTSCKQLIALSRRPYGRRMMAVTPGRRRAIKYVYEG